MTMRPDHPMEFRFMGDNSVTEGYAMLFDHLMQDAGWLRRYTLLESPGIPEFLRSAGFEELHFLRRYCAKLIYETHLYGGEHAWDALPDLYVELLTGETPFRKAYLGAIIDRVEVDDHQIKIMDRKDVLEQAVMANDV